MVDMLDAAVSDAVDHGNWYENFLELTKSSAGGNVWYCMEHYCDFFFLLLARLLTLFHDRIDCLSVLPSYIVDADASKILSLCPSLQKATKVFFVRSFFNLCL